MKAWRDSGYWTKDALMSKMDTNQSFVNGKSASVLGQYTPPLLVGYAKDVDKAVEDLNAKVKAA